MKIIIYCLLKKERSCGQTDVDLFYSFYTGGPQIFIHCGTLLLGSIYYIRISRDTL
jgi:hypothetical protein